MEETLMLVGEVARKLGVSVRTLQYYDKEKLCSPSAYSEGGRRLYCGADIIKLHQILSMKYLGLSLEQIRSDLPKLETTTEVVSMLDEQCAHITGQIENLHKVKTAISKLSEEVKAMNQVNWTKYASILDMLKLGDSMYWAVKHLEEKTIMSAAHKFDKNSADVFAVNMEKIWDKFGQLVDDNIDPDSEQSVALAKEMWDMIMEFSSGDKEILNDVFSFGQNLDTWQNEKWKQKFSKVQEYSSKALVNYFIKYNVEVNL